MSADWTLERKIAQLGSVWVVVGADGELEPFRGFGGRSDASLTELVRHGAGQLTRPLGHRAVDAADGARAIAVFQAERDVGAIVHEECLSGYMAHGATAFPCPLNLGSAWDPSLAEAVAGAIGSQMRSVGVHQGLAPLLDVVRDHRWGRVEETFGEDPYLVGTTGAAYVRGLEGAGIVATPKHFCGYPASEGGRNLAPAHLGPRELRDVLLPPFEMAVRLGGARAVMSAYQDNDGLPASADPTLLTTVLRDEWGFDGIVVSDYFAVRWLHELHGVAGDAAEAAALALRAGVDVELPNTDCYGDALLEAVARGLVDEALVDRSVERVLRLKRELGLLGSGPASARGPIDLDLPEHRGLARRAAEESIVLLRNDGVLPLRDDVRMALIGPNADSWRALLGNYSFQNHVPDAPEGVAVVSVSQALGVPAVRGCDVIDPDTSRFAEAEAAARQADVAVVVIGDQAGNFGRGTSGEGTDADDLRLPGVQEELISTVVATGTPTVVVLVSGRSYDLSRVGSGAIVWAGFPGEEGGMAIADVLFGRVNPSGKASLSFGRGAGQQPFTYHHKRLGRRGYARSTSRPVFPFGHGLSYTTFAYGELEVDGHVPVDGTVTIACTVANEGDRTGAEVVQLYVHDPVASVTRPAIELKGYTKLELAPGASARVSFSLHTDLLSFMDADLRRVVEPGTIDVMIGSSSEDVRLRSSFELTGPTREVGAGRTLLCDVEVTR